MGDLQTITELHVRYLTSSGMVAEGNGVTGGDAPWTAAPDGYQPFDNAGVAAMPALAANATIVTFLVPLGMDGVITRLGNDFVGIGFQDGVGDIVWRITRDGVAVQGYDSISVRLGTISAPRHLSPGIRIYSGQVVTMIVNNVTNVLAGSILGTLGGYFYPTRGN